MTLATGDSKSPGYILRNFYLVKNDKTVNNSRTTTKAKEKAQFWNSFILKTVF
jgi:hypothetical protein